MKRTSRNSAASIAAAAALLQILATALPAQVLAQDMMQLQVPSTEYTLGRFKYQPPKVDGWRQIANIKDSLSLVYAEQKSEGQIETKFGVALEAHEIPAGTPIADGATLAMMSKTQMAEARKADLVAQSTLAPVPGIDGLYTYRLLVHAPVKTEPDAYEVYYIMMAPDKTQYLVIQAITKTPDYGNELYFNQFFGSLSSIKYDPAAGGTGIPATKPETAPDAGTTAPAH